MGLIVVFILLDLHFRPIFKTGFTPTLKKFAWLHHYRQDFSEHRSTILVHSLNYGQSIYLYNMVFADYLQS